MNNSLKTDKLIKIWKYMMVIFDIQIIIFFANITYQTQKHDISVQQYFNSFQQ